MARPKLENPRSFTIPETRVTREEKRMFKIKAALFTNGSTARLVREAVEKFKGEIPTTTCSSCRKEMQIHFVSEVFPFDIAGKEHQINLKEIPIYKCTCGNEEEDLRLFAAIEEELGEEVHWRLNNRKELPDELNFFNDFLKLKKEEMTLV